jgi:hypothetical protein
MNKGIKALTNSLMVYALIIAGITVYQRIQAYQLGGACPVPLQKPWLYSGIAAASIAFVLLFIVEKRKGASE